MRKSRSLLFIIFILLTVCISMHAFESDKLPIEVFDGTSERGKTTLGSLFVYEVKERIRNSSTMRLTNTNEVRIVLRIQTMPKDRDYPDNSIIYTVNWLLAGDTVFPYFLYSTLGYCGRSVYEDAAKSIVADTDSIIEYIKSAFN